MDIWRFVRRWIFRFSGILPIGVHHVLRDIFGMFHRGESCHVSLPLHHIFPSAGIAGLFDDMIGSTFPPLNSIVFALSWFFVPFSKIFYGYF